MWLMKSVKKTLKKYFIPHTENDHKPHFLRGKVVFKTGLLASALFVLSLVGNYAVKHIEYLAAIQSAFLVDLANEDREDSGLAKLSINDQLINAAQFKADDMSAKSYFAHISPDGSTPWSWIQKAGYNYLYAGENLAVNFSRSEDVEEAWMDSPTHKANILSKNFTEIGIATASGKYKGKNTTFVVQMFGRQKKTPTVNTVSAASAVVEANDSEEAPQLATENSNNGSEVSEDSSVLGSETEVASTVESSKEETEITVKPEAVAEESEETFMSFTNPEATPAELSEAPVEIKEEAVYTNWFERIIVSPSRVVQSLLVALAAIVVFSLILKIFIEIRLQHPKNIAYGVALLAIIVIFMHINGSVLAKPILVVAF